MSNMFLDSQNYVETFDDAPDKLRAELGLYYGPGLTQPNQNRSIASNKVMPLNVDNDITSLSGDDDAVIPVIKQRVYFYGQESEFRDQVQWREHVRSIVLEDTTFRDHTYSGEKFTVDNGFYNNYFDPTYEDATKAYNTNLLINYNLINYRFQRRSKTVREIGSLVTPFDRPDYAVNAPLRVRQLLREYENRLTNFTGSLTEISERQRHIFVITDDDSTVGVPTGSMPFNYSKTIAKPNTPSLLGIKHLAEETKTEKFVHQALKTNLAFQNLSFRTPEGVDSLVRCHDLIDLVLRTNLTNFSANFDELFLLDGTERLNNEEAFLDRFINGARAINFMSGFLSLVKTPNLVKDISRIYNSTGCVKEVVGLKIEKYLDNDVTLPTQTYYINDSNYNFVDTQLKYGRKYIYKTYALVAVVGSSYKYSKLAASQDDNTMQNFDGTFVADHGADINKKYRGMVDVEIVPSIKILEIPLDDHSVAFYDQPPMPPLLTMYNQSGERKFRAILHPNLNSAHNYTVNAPRSVEEMIGFTPLVDSDQRVLELLVLSKDNVYDSVFKPDYFTGRYEVYRLDNPPQQVADFAGNFLAEVDMDATIMHHQETIVRPAGPNRRRITKIREIKQNNQTAHFEDTLVPNKKYYYIFRALTYHGTPSNHTPIYEIELIEDSDETKLNISEYKIPEVKDFTLRKMSKRILRITPNFEQLTFTGDETSVSDALRNLGTTDFKLMPVGPPGAQTVSNFKIRVTSKHTGKKMDLNLTFKVVDRN